MAEAGTAVSVRPRVYTPAEEERLATNLLAVATEVHQGGWSDRQITVDLLRDLHRRLFDGVRDIGGQVRRQGFGSEYLTFGPNRSSSNRDAPNLLLDLFAKIEPALRWFSDHRDVANYEEEALAFAARHHADIIKIHPFEDGNGRSCRQLLNVLLLRLGLRPIAVDTVKEEYHRCLNFYFDTRQLRPLFDLLLDQYRL